MTLSIRRATAADADFIVWTFLTAQRGHLPSGYFDLAFGWPEPRLIGFLKTIATHSLISWWHVSRFWITEVDDAPAAALCAVPARGAIDAASQVVRQALVDAGITPDEQAAISQRGAYVRNCFMPGDDANWVVEHVAVDPRYRNRGLMQQLLAHALADGASHGYRRASIMFYIGNDPAERCYTQAGFTFAEERRDATFEAITGAQGFRRFERPI